MKRLIAFLLLSIPFGSIAQPGNPAGLSILVVMAHPDDETMCAGTIYKLTHTYGAKVDLVCITNGEGGYKYSSLGSEYYGIELTNPAIGRQYLPAIRKQELLNAGKILGIRNTFFLDQTDDKYGLNPKAALDTFWNAAMVEERLIEMMNKSAYDFVFCLLPEEGTHGHHKAATILALRSVKNVKPLKQPIVLGVSKDDLNKKPYMGLDGYPETAADAQVPIFQFSLGQRFGFKDKLDYHIVLNWVVAEHKSQGAMPYAVIGTDDHEQFVYMAANPAHGVEKTVKMFDLLKVSSYPSLSYSTSGNLNPDGVKR